ncbi:hypothetical protein HPB48_022163 [Haemaphysalis longicornis]|uniref:Uncharacterized protein n=1 Tax=Haemaphysalis longicornis TaxID=44386 RepID=A0A9J6GVQ9_HAELO|nr:hypothetical protein HPB48_022163 [Haemaphysalis longicornis]
MSEACAVAVLRYLIKGVKNVSELDKPRFNKTSTRIRVRAECQSGHCLRHPSRGGAFDGDCASDLTFVIGYCCDEARCALLLSRIHEADRVRGILDLPQQCHSPCSPSTRIVLRLYVFRKRSNHDVVP